VTTPPSGNVPGCKYGHAFGAATPDKPLSLGLWAEGNQTDVLVRVRVPATPTTVYISVKAEVKFEFYINFPGTSTANRSDETPWAAVEVGLLTADPYVSFKDTLRLWAVDQVLELRLLVDHAIGDQVLELRLLVDHAIVEAYLQGGRVAMTAPAPLTERTSIVLSMDTAAGATVEIEGVEVWHVRSAWVR
jgi:hypothetical protein